jgi:hypothetical protein
MKIECVPLAGTDQKVIQDMMNGHSAEPSDVITTDTGLEITYEGSTIQKGITPDSFNEILGFSIQLGSTIAVGIATNFIYDVLKGRIQKLWINSKEVPVDKNEIQKAIEEQHHETDSSSEVPQGK